MDGFPWTGFKNNILCNESCAGFKALSRSHVLDNSLNNSLCQPKYSKSGFLK